MRTNEKVTTIAEAKDVAVKVNYFEAARDQMIKLDNVDGLPTAWIHANVKLDLMEFTETFEYNEKSMDLAVVRLYINDEFIGEVFEMGDVEQTKDGQKIFNYDVIVAYD